MTIATIVALAGLYARKAHIWAGLVAIAGIVASIDSGNAAGFTAALTSLLSFVGVNVNLTSLLTGLASLSSLLAALGVHLSLPTPPTPSSGPTPPPQAP